ncbi:Mannan polymerase II complex anp1 subunit [Coemansia aciculifera]|uniref:Mannan polymerase II complex anp1 subunit n=1 Tax=Coemansia aciculifera TaxID=417176 RepID=A0A9W8IG06_9FUNG|nr:Mannan polymerase II complex anp1 subunit [Coemansia aciculifera]KAJ2872460.1 Mannan polymerase II complex anp1 subunit [Coemansia aciculifera]
MNAAKAIKDACVIRVSQLMANGRWTRSVRTPVVKIALVLACGLLMLLSVQYLNTSSPSVEEEIKVEPKVEPKYVEALGYDYQPQPKEEKSWLPKLISYGKSSWSVSELDSFSDESRKILKSDKAVAPQTIDPDSDSVLILTPMKNNAGYMSKYFELIEALEFPRHKISLAFLVSDSTDNTQKLLIQAKKKYQEQGPKEMRFKRFDIYRQDFFNGMPGHERHLRERQRERRIVMARARNYLWTRALGNEQWVAWIDGDLTAYPPTILRDLMAYDKDIIVPNCMYPIAKNNLPYSMYDYNAWQETPESLAMIKGLKEDDFLVEGYPALKTHRKHLDDFGKDDIIVSLDGVGGTFTLVKAYVHRSGVGFPTWLFQHQVETEGFAKLAKANGFGVFGLPNYNIHHVSN